MRGLSRLIIGMAALADPATGAERAAEAAMIRAMSFNIRLDLASDGNNRWSERKAMVVALIREEAPDILGLQEVLLHQKRDLENGLSRYAMVGAGRDDGKDKGEFSPIAYRKARFALVDSGTVWLSKTPFIPGKSWDAAFPRIATWAFLRQRETGTVIRVINTHFDHVGIVARRQSAAMLSSWLAQGDWASLPTIVMGDLNSEPGTDGYRLLADGPAGLRDARLASTEPPSGPEGTFNEFRLDAAPTRRIDHLFVSGHFSVRRYAVVARHWDGRLPSDHYPVTAELRLNDR